jgi:hypothetical protein
MYMYASGSAYLVRQSGGDRVGGLQVLIRPKQGEVGSITVKPTDIRSAELQCDPTWFVENATRGIREVAEKADIDLNSVDIELSRFLFNEVDSRKECYYQAAKSAFRTALEMWFLKDLDA